MLFGFLEWSRNAFFHNRSDQGGKVNYLRVISVVFILTVTSGCTVIRNVENAYERAKLADNLNGDGTHDIDCDIIMVRGEPSCDVHRTIPCPTIANGNRDPKTGQWTICRPAEDAKGFAYCLEHGLYTCPMLATWSLEHETQQVASSGPTASCKKVYTAEGAACATHPDNNCFAPELKCYEHGRVQLCGVIRKGSVERRDTVLLEDGVAKSGNVLLGMLLPATNSVHTAYIWAYPPKQAKR